MMISEAAVPNEAVRHKDTGVASLLPATINLHSPRIARLSRVFPHQKLHSRNTNDSPSRFTPTRPFVCSIWDDQEKQWMSASRLDCFRSFKAKLQNK
jgi:hypothetical protein